MKGDEGPSQFARVVARGQQLLHQAVDGDDAFLLIIDAVGEGRWRDPKDMGDIRWDGSGQAVGGREHLAQGLILDVVR